MRPIPRPGALAGCALLLALAAACGPSGPEYVYVPGPGFQEALVARADLPDSGAVRTGEWVTLHANRLSGPWRRARRVEVADSAPCMRPSAPESAELGVESQVAWTVEPEGGASWNTPGPPYYQRQVRFSEPGHYRLQAVSEGCREPFRSMPVEITVE